MPATLLYTLSHVFHQPNIYDKQNFELLSAEGFHTLSVSHSWAKADLDLCILEPKYEFKIPSWLASLAAWAVINAMNLMLPQGPYGTQEITNGMRSQGWGGCTSYNYEQEKGVDTRRRIRMYREGDLYNQNINYIIMIIRDNFEISCT